MEQIDFTQDLQNHDGCAISRKLRADSLPEMREQLQALVAQNKSLAESRTNTPIDLMDKWMAQLTENTTGESQLNSGRLQIEEQGKYDRMLTTSITVSKDGQELFTHNFEPESGNLISRECHSNKFE